MRTTVDVDHVLAAARRLAAQEGRTLGAVVEDALREVLDRHEDRPEQPFTAEGRDAAPDVNVVIDAHHRESPNNAAWRHPLAG